MSHILINVKLLIQRILIKLKKFITYNQNKFNIKVI